jgi:hypothetical protein
MVRVDVFPTSIGGGVHLIEVRYRYRYALAA